MDPLKKRRIVSVLINFSCDFYLQSRGGFANFPVLLDVRGQVAQLVEQRTENPCVGGSNPPLPIFVSIVFISACPIFRRTHHLCLTSKLASGVIPASLWFNCSASVTV